MGRARATSSEWRQYYERAERARARFGDPFQRHVEHLARRNRLVRVAVVVAAMAATLVAVSLLIWFVDDVSLDALLGG